MKYLYLFTFLIIIISCLAGNPVLAYTEKTLGGNLTATIRPLTPKPGEKITISLTSFEIDLDSAPIEWIIDEETAQSGVGLKEFSTVAGARGDISSIIIKVTRPNGNKIVKTITYLPASVNLIYSTDSYTPTLYKGHSLPSPGSKVKITAITEFINAFGENTPPSKLNFTWKTGSDTLVRASGTGKNSATIRLGDLYEETTVTVIVSEPTTKTTVEKKITIKTTDPKILVYKLDPLMGVLYNQAINDNYQMSGSEETFKAEPYFFSLTDWLDDQLNFTWLINGKQPEIGEGDKRLLSLSRPGSGSNIASLNIRVENKKNIFQNGNTTVRIKY